MRLPEPADVVAAAEALAPLRTVADENPRWQGIAAPTTWTAQRSVEHICDALLFYCGQVARRADRRLPVLRDGRRAPASEQLDNALTSAHVLAELLAGLGSARAWHPSGRADCAGWVGMAVTELLVHGHDAAVAMGVDLSFPDAVCEPTVARAFPWIRGVPETPSRLLLAVTGRAPLTGVPNDPQWWWQSAPLAEWDGRPRRRTSAPGWSP